MDRGSARELNLLFFHLGYGVDKRFGSALWSAKSRSHRRLWRAAVFSSQYSPGPVASACPSLRNVKLGRYREQGHPYSPAHTDLYL